MNPKTFNQYLYLSIAVAMRFRTQALLLILVGFSPAQIMGDTVTLASGSQFNGTFYDTGVCGLGIRVLPRREYAVTRCSYTANLAGIRLNFIDGAWFKLPDALSDIDLALSLQYCLAYNNKQLNLELKVPAKIGTMEEDNYRRYLNLLIQKKLSKYMLQNNNKIFWFYMRYARFIDADGEIQYVPIGIIDKIQRNGIEISAMSLFLEEQDRTTNLQALAIGAEFQNIQRAKLQMIMFLPQTADGPDWNLQFASGQVIARAQALQRNIVWDTTKVIWRRRYLDILHYAR